MLVNVCAACLCVCVYVCVCVLVCVCVCRHRHLSGHTCAPGLTGVGKNAESFWLSEASGVGPAPSIFGCV